MILGGDVLCYIKECPWKHCSLHHDLYYKYEVSFTVRWRSVERINIFGRERKIAFLIHYLMEANTLLPKIFTIYKEISRARQQSVQNFSYLVTIVILKVKNYNSLMSKDISSKTVMQRGSG